jgi:hypothetical protein
MISNFGKITGKISDNTGQKCEEDVEVKYKFPYPFWIIPSRNDDRF